MKTILIHLTAWYWVIGLQLGAVYALWLVNYRTTNAATLRPAARFRLLVASVGLWPWVAHRLFRQAEIPESQRKGMSLRKSDARLEWISVVIAICLLVAGAAGWGNRTLLVFGACFAAVFATITDLECAISTEVQARADADGQRRPGMRIFILTMTSLCCLAAFVDWS